MPLFADDLTEDAEGTYEAAADPEEAPKDQEPEGAIESNRSAGKGTQPIYDYTKH